MEDLTIKNDRFKCIIEKKSPHEDIKWLEVQVIDQGLGISSQNQKKLFKPFAYFDTHGVNKEGTGLGLYITKIMTKQFNGNIVCQSEEGKGATFTFIIQLKNFKHVTEY